jgi:hypothetical protein
VVLANGQNLRGRQLRIVVPFSLKNGRSPRAAGLAALSHHVSGVVDLSPEKEMINVNAPRVSHLCRT